MAGKTKYQKCIARELRGKHTRGREGQRRAFARAARKCAKACRPKNKRVCRRK